MLYPLQNISRVLLRILFPAFSTIQNDNNKFKRVYLKTIFFIALVSFPIMAGLVATADLLVAVLFGDKWFGLAQILMILAPVGIIQSIGTTNGSIFMAKGNTRLLLRVGIFSTVVTIAFFVGGLFWGVEGVAFSYLLSNIVLFYPSFSYLLGTNRTKRIRRSCCTFASFGYSLNNGCECMGIRAMVRYAFSLPHCTAYSNDCCRCSTLYSTANTQIWEPKKVT